VVFVCLGICYGIGLAMCHDGKTKIPGDHENFTIVRHVGLQVDFSLMKSSLGL
jgi:hypothetical protein